MVGVVVLGAIILLGNKLGVIIQGLIVWANYQMETF